MTENQPNLHKQPLPPNLHEKMEYVISQFIEELHDAGRIETIHDSYERLPYEAFLRNKLFDLSYVNIFNQISNNYFNQEDKNELQLYYRPDPRRGRMTITQYQYIHIYLTGINFARQNKSFITNNLDNLNTSKSVLK